VLLFGTFNTSLHVCSLWVVVLDCVYVNVTEWPVAVACFISASIILTAVIFTCRCVLRHHAFNSWPTFSSYLYNYRV